MQNIQKTTYEDLDNVDLVENPNGWDPWVISPNKVKDLIIINECAEMILTECLFDLHEELKEIVSADINFGYLSHHSDEYLSLIEE